VPADDAEAARRILTATRALVDVKGAEVTLTDVAEALGVTRQTVYRYFAGTDALLLAAAEEAAGGFLGAIGAHLAGVTDPATAITEGIAFTIEELPRQPYVGLLLQAKHVGSVSAILTSDVAMSFGRAMIERFDVDWAAAGLGEADLVELTEAMLRAVQTFVIDPGRPPRRGADLRRYLGRWVVPAALAAAGPADNRVSDVSPG
jgi:AcrR family transcriptional regulator